MKFSDEWGWPSGGLWTRHLREAGHRWADNVESRSSLGQAGVLQCGAVGSVTMVTNYSIFIQGVLCPLQPSAPDTASESRPPPPRCRTRLGTLSSATQQRASQPIPAVPHCCCSNQEKAQWRSVLIVIVRRGDPWRLEALAATRRARGRTRPAPEHTGILEYGEDVIQNCKSLRKSASSQRSRNEPCSGQASLTTGGGMSCWLVFYVCLSRMRQLDNHYVKAILIWARLRQQ
jgi:hypothetical protein